VLISKVLWEDYLMTMLLHRRADIAAQCETSTRSERKLLALLR